MNQKTTSLFYWWLVVDWESLLFLKRVFCHLKILNIHDYAELNISRSKGAITMKFSGYIHYIHMQELY